MIWTIVAIVLLALSAFAIIELWGMNRELKYELIEIAKYKGIEYDYGYRNDNNDNTNT